MGLALPALAQNLPRPAPPPINDPLNGHSAVYYGMSAPSQQEASIRSVLSNVGVDQAFLPRSLAAESARFLVGLVLGGVGAPTDLANPGPDVRDAGAREEGHGTVR